MDGPNEFFPFLDAALDAASAKGEIIHGGGLSLTGGRGGKLASRDVAVTLSQQAATALNGAFNVTAFSAGLPIGMAKVKAKGLTPL